MIEALSRRMAIKLKEVNPEETASVEVMSYALQGILHNAITFITAFLAGILFGHFVDTLIAVVCFMGLRFVSGGFHFKSALACFLFSATIFIGIPFLDLNDHVLMIINGASLVLAALFAPSNIKEHIRVSERYFPVFKLLSVLLVTINFIYLMPVVTLAFFAQAASLIPFKKEVKSL
ncbi:accessory gene regulator ArgB-like protein [Cohnella yongneupensis]|uniref:Accessory gene regulator ArgB-like protein n=1 Tax=Cohnella yongneupensis TaxID=425006 RepID=A0ABW0QZD5_9BACL